MEIAGALILAVLALGEAACAREEPVVPTMAAAPAETSATAVAQAQQTGESTATPLVRADDGEEIISDIGKDPHATRITTARVSFDLQGKTPGFDRRAGPEVDGIEPADRNRAMYQPLYDYYLREQAVAMTDVVNTLDHARLLAAQDEFESDAAKNERVQRWVADAKAIFRRRVGSKDYEVFGIGVPPDAATYDANEKAWRVWLPPLPPELDSRDHNHDFLAAHPDLRRRLESDVPLGHSQLRAGWDSQGLGYGSSGKKRSRLVPDRIFIPMENLEKAREVKERFEAGRAFYYIRFTPDMDVDWWDGSPRPIRSASFSVFLQPVTVAVYTTESLEVIGFMGRGAEKDLLWFLTNSALKRGAAVTGGTP